MFVCPECSRTCYRLHFINGVWHCRICARLGYRSQYRDQTVPGLARIRYLRRRLGASPELFTPISPRCPDTASGPVRRGSEHRVYLKLVLEVRELEAQIPGYLRTDINDVLEARDGKRKRNRRRRDDPARGDDGPSAK